MPSTPCYCSTTGDTIVEEWEMVCDDEQGGGLSTGWKELEPATTPCGTALQTGQGRMCSASDDEEVEGGLVVLQAPGYALPDQRDDAAGRLTPQRSPTVNAIDCKDGDSLSQSCCSSPYLAAARLQTKLPSPGPSCSLPCSPPHTPRAECSPLQPSVRLSLFVTEQDGVVVGLQSTPSAKQQQMVHTLTGNTSQAAVHGGLHVEAKCDSQPNLSATCSSSKSTSAAQTHSHDAVHTPAQDARSAAVGVLSAAPYSARPTRSVSSANLVIISKPVRRTSSGGSSSTHKRRLSCFSLRFLVFPSILCIIAAHHIICGRSKGRPHAHLVPFSSPHLLLSSCSSTLSSGSASAFAGSSSESCLCVSS